MPIYPHHKAIFVHIPKNGGSTVTTMLKRRRMFDIMPAPEDPRGQGCETILQYMAAIGDDTGDYFKFSFVRNPWDRLVSAYHYIKQRRPELDRVNRHADFRAFVADLSKEPEPYLNVRYLRPQWTYVCDAKGSVPLDFVGHFERFDGDMRHVFKALGLARTWIRHRKRSSRGDYREYYDEWSRDAVREVYIRDVEAWGYRFDPSS